MVVGCPKCKSRLNVPDAKVTPGGIKVKCPKCAAVLLVKKPKTLATAPAAPTAAPAEKKLDRTMVFVAHENPDSVERMRAVLTGRPYRIISSLDGVDTLVKAKRAMPFLFILDIGLPKINGFEVARRLRDAAETREAKIILVSHAGDRQRQQKQPAAEYGVDAYIEDAEIESNLAGAISVALGEKPAEKAAPPAKEEPQEMEAPAPEAEPSPAIEPPAQPSPEAPSAETAARPSPQEPPRVTPQAPPEPSPAPPQAPPVRPAAAASPSSARALDNEVERAKRLARTVLSDIDLYSPQKVLEAVKTGSFQSVFADDLKEGLKHYENRIPAIIRNKGNFFQEAIDEFVERKKKLLGTQ